MRKIPGWLVFLSLGTAQAQPGVQAFGASTTDTRILMTWTESGGQLLGSLQTVKMIPTEKGTNVMIVNNIVRGVFVGKSYQFTLEGSPLFYGATAVSGTISKDVLALAIPSSKGGFINSNLSRTTLAKFNTSVAELDSKTAKISATLQREAEVRAKKTADESRKATEAQDKLTALQLVLTKREGAERLFNDISKIPLETSKYIKTLTDDISFRREALERLADSVKNKDCSSFYTITSQIYASEEAKTALDDMTGLRERLQMAIPQIDDSLENYKNGHRDYLTIYKVDPKLPGINDLDAKFARLKIQFQEKIFEIDRGVKYSSENGAKVISEGEKMACESDI